MLPATTITDTSLKSARNAELDILRGVAIFAILILHMFPGPDALLVPRSVMTVVSKGWVGVDLFFVLSGFLVSGLLFNEFERDGKVDVARFLARRGFKIYPAYYALVGVGLLVLVVTHNPWHELVPVMLFYCNYLYDWFPTNSASNSIWSHCWSVSVEEHFYLLLSLTVWLISRQQHSLRAVPYICVAVCLFVPVVRFITFYSYPIPTKILYATHLRVDALSFGVLLSYLYRHHEVAVRALFFRRSIIWYSLAAFLTAPCLIGELGNPFCYIFGLTMLYVGFGIVLLTLVINAPPLNFVTSGIASIGVYSYSIYIWHRLFQLGSAVFVPSEQGKLLALKVLVYFATSIFGGILLSKLIEMPMLALRDRLIPKRKNSSNAEGVPQSSVNQSTTDKTTGPARADDQPSKGDDR